MLYSALLIHLTGGRIETHFHIFGSLAFLSFYRDWRVLITASLVVVADHVLRGIYFPMSIYGVNAIEPLRWMEHTWWVVFEDFFLINCCQANVAEMHAIAARQAEVELTRDNVEELVKQRTMELQRSEQKLAGQLVENSQLANIVEWAGDAIIGQTLDGIITSWNNGARVLFGYTSDEIKGKNISTLTPPAKLAELKELVSGDQRGETLEGLETQRLRKDGIPLTVSLTRSPVFSSNQEIIGICEVIHNISDRKEAERRVSEFYSIVSHELRTPLTSVRGALGLVENGVVEPGSEEASELITVARESTDRLIRLINDILDLKKIESGKMELHVKALPVAQLIEDCIKSLAGMTELAEVKLKSEMDFSGQFMGDRDKTTQILTNLISNAVKFSPGDSTVIVRCEKRPNGMVRFSVTDHGPGISAADQEKLFGKFQQLDSSDTRQNGGTGLGLAISKALVNELGGNIGMDSEVGHGCTFWFELAAVGTSPTANDTEPDTTSGDNLEALGLDAASTGAAKRILLVEDDADLAQVLKVHFKKTDHETHWAGTLNDARRLLKTIVFDVVVLDLCLPDGSGLDLLEQIRASERTAKLPVIIVTGQNIDNSLKVKGDVADWLPKPFDTKELVRIIDRVTTTNSVRAVMVSDCDTGVREVVGNELRALGLQCIDGLDELKILTRQNDQIFPVIVYLSRNLTAEEKKSLSMNTSNECPQEKSTRLDLLDAVSELIGGICKWTASSAQSGTHTEHKAIVRVLMIEDDKYYVEFVRQLLIRRTSPRFDITSEHSLEAAISQLQNETPDVILLDLNLPDSKGLLSLTRVKELSYGCPVIILTSADDDTLGLQAVCSGAQDYLVKQNVSNDSLVRCIRYAIERRRVEEQKMKLALIQDFVATLAHDMRVPLIGANKLLDALLAGTTGMLTQEQTELVETLKESNQNQLGLVKRLLEIYRYEAGTAELSMVAIDVPAAIARAIETCRKDFGGEIDLKMPTDLKNSIIQGDEEAMARLFTDLINNAVTFSEPGKSITINLSDDANKLNISVHNFGQAIPKDAQNVLFQKFWQGVPGKHYVAHTGLGLYLCHRIVQLHRGRITCTSGLKEGTTITVTLPRN